MRHETGRRDKVGYRVHTSLLPRSSLEEPRSVAALIMSGGDTTTKTKKYMHAIMTKSNMSIADIAWEYTVPITKANCLPLGRLARNNGGMPCQSRISQRSLSRLPPLGR